MDAFSIIGFTFGITALAFSMAAMKQTSELKTEVEKLKKAVQDSAR